jgi:ERCC4-type nuclease
MTDLDKCSLYLLSRCEGIGPIKAAKLLAHFSSPSDLMHTSSKELHEKLIQLIPQIELFFVLIGEKSG